MLAANHSRIAVTKTREHNAILARASFVTEVDFVIWTERLIGFPGVRAPALAARDHLGRRERSSQENSYKGGPLWRTSIVHADHCCKPSPP